MDESKGRLTIEELGRRVASGAVDTVVVAVPDSYGRLVGKRYDGEFFLEACAEGGGHFCDYLLTVNVGMDPVPGYRFANWTKGYGDMHVVPDLSTLREASWLDRTAHVFCDVVAEGGELVSVAPRSVLKRQLERLADLGYEAKAGSELEFFIYRDSYRDAAGKGYAGLEPSGWYVEDYHTLQTTREEDLVGAVRRHLRDSGVPVENSKGEWGRGQHELNVRYAEMLEMADRHLVYKQCVKEVADAMGRSVTFMAKPATEEAGSSCHVHVSLWKEGEAAFAGEAELGGALVSDVFRWFLGGWIAHAPELMAFYAPNPNSYKRYRAGSWAPTRLAWSVDNRTAGFRIVGAGPSLRIECRIPGADCNPYLVYAAAVASGLDGIENRTEPPEIFRGDAYVASDVPEVPGSLREAAGLLEGSALARRAFGEEVVEHFVHFFRNEQKEADLAVTDWERRRYFEQI